MLSREIIYLSMPGRVPIYICCPDIIIGGTPFNYEICPSLDNKLYSHPSVKKYVQQTERQIRLPKGKKRVNHKVIFEGKRAVNFPNLNKDMHPQFESEL